MASSGDVGALVNSHRLLGVAGAEELVRTVRAHCVEAWSGCVCMCAGVTSAARVKEEADERERN